MTGNRKLRDAIAVCLTLLAAVLSLRMSMRHPGELSTLDRAILKLVFPAQAAVSSAIRAVGGVAGRYVDLIHVRSENQALKRENDRLRSELLESRRMAADLARAQQLLGLRDRTPGETVAARVISVDASPYFRIARVEIDRGEGAVRRGMPVLTPEGVVGRVNRVSASSADVLLTVDPRSALDVVVPRTGGRGILRGKAGENGYRCAVEYLVRGEPVKVGDAVTTSGLGGGFPRDLPVGKVSRVAQNDAGLYQEVEVTPDVDFTRLSEVLVLVAPPPGPEGEPGARRPAPARGAELRR